MSQRDRLRFVGLALLAALVAVAGVVMALGAGPGSTLVTIAIGTAPSAVAVDDRAGRAFVISVADKAVSVLDTTSGRLVRTVTIGVGPLAVDGAAGRAFVLNGNGTATQLAAALAALGHYEGTNSKAEHAREAARLGGEGYYRLLLAKALLGHAEAALGPHSRARFAHAIDARRGGRAATPTLVDLQPLGASLQAHLGLITGPRTSCCNRQSTRSWSRHLPTRRRE